MSGITPGIGGFDRDELVSLPSKLILSKAIRPFIPWYENMTSSIKLKDILVLHHCQRRTEPQRQASCIKKLVKCGHAIFELYEQTHTPCRGNRCARDACTCFLYTPNIKLVHHHSNNKNMLTFILAALPTCITDLSRRTCLSVKSRSSIIASWS